VTRFPLFFSFFFATDIRLFSHKSRLIFIPASVFWVFPIFTVVFVVEAAQIIIACTRVQVPGIKIS